MKISPKCRILVLVIFGVLGAGQELVLLAQKPDSADKDRMAIEQLHRLDVETTLTGKADELTKLWDEDAVRIQPVQPAEVGRATIYADDQRWEAAVRDERPLCYRPEIQDLKITGDWAFEWGYFSYQSSAQGKLVVGRGKLLRVLHRQPNGSWKFARVMVLPEKLASAAPVSNPCR